MNISVFKQAQGLIAENSAAILSGTAVVGVVTTAYLAAKGALQARKALVSSQIALGENDPRNEDEIIILEELTITEKIKIVVPIMAPAVLAGSATIGAIIGSYHISTSKSAALAAAYAISERSYSEYKDKVLETVGEKKVLDIKDAVDQQRIENNPPPAPTAFIIGNDEVLCLDAFSGRYFRSTVETIRRAENDVNAIIGADHVCPLSVYYQAIGFEDAEFASEFRWTTHNYCQLDYTTQKTDDGRPCLVVSFVNPPQPKDYDISRYS